MAKFRLRSRISTTFSGIALALMLSGSPPHAAPHSQAVENKQVAAAIARSKTPCRHVPSRWKTVAQLDMQGDTTRLRRLASQALKLDTGNTELLELQGQSQYLAKHYRAAAGTLERLVNAAEMNRKHPAGEPTLPDRSSLRRLAAATIPPPQFARRAWSGIFIAMFSTMGHREKHGVVIHCMGIHLRPSRFSSDSILMC